MGCCKSPRLSTPQALQQRAAHRRALWLTKDDSRQVTNRCVRGERDKSSVPDHRHEQTVDVFAIFEKFFALAPFNDEAQFLVNVDAALVVGEHIKLDPFDDA